jgi:hypothetical protein
MLGAWILVGALASSARGLDLYAGAAGGVHVGDLTGDGADAAKTKTGFVGGGYLGADFHPHFGLRLEGLFVMRGAKGSIVTPGDDHAHDSTWSVNDVELPLLFVAGWPIRESVRLSGFAGPTFGFNVDSDIETGHGTEDVRHLTKSFALGGTLGLGIEYRLHRVAITSDVRYTQGVTSIVEDVAGQEVGIEPRGLGVMLGVKVPLASL